MTLLYSWHDGNVVDVAKVTKPIAMSDVQVEDSDD